MSASLPASATPSANVADFERSLDELEQLVGRMEKGDMSLDDSLQAFERGVSLYRNCQGALEQAELRVRMLMDPNDPASAVPFDPDTP
jgi:exodeoxyribonuclease VII small subunit